MPFGGNCQWNDLLELEPRMKLRGPFLKQSSIKKYKKINCP